MRQPRTFLGRLGTAVAALALAAPVTATVSIQTESPAAAAEAETLRYDFGPEGSHVAGGYTEVDPTTQYSAEQGYGFEELIDFVVRDRGGEGAGRDFVSGFGTTYTFLADVPVGTYAVTAIVGETAGTARTVLTMEGEQYPEMLVQGTVEQETFAPVEAADGQLTLEVSGRTGHLSGLVVEPLLASPAGLQATDVVVDGEDVTVELAWDPVEGADSYRVNRVAAGGTEELAGEVDGPTSTFSDTGAELGQDYTYTVTAVDGSGLESLPSDPVEVTTVDPAVAAPATPSGLEVTATEKNTVSLAWDDADAAEDVLFWAVYRGDAGGDLRYIGRTSEPVFTDDSVLTTIEYTYAVAAVNEGGYSEQSDTVTSEAVTVLDRATERVDRSPVAVATGEGVYVGWRLLATDPDGVGFHVYRDGERITEEPLTGSTNLVDPDGGPDSTYRVSSVVAGKQLRATPDFGVTTATADGAGALDVPLQVPAGGTTQDGEFTYSANDVSVGDLDGDGQYELVVKWYPSNAQDNSRPGFTGDTLLEAYELDGTRLWRIDLGRNIRSGAHYTQLVVYDLDSDGRAEVAVKTADGTVDGAGAVIGDPEADYRNSSGYVLDGPEFLTVFDGRTGAAVDTVDYVPPRGNVSDWGDGYGNRVDRFLAGVAYLDGEQPSALFSRGYYTRSVITAFDFDGSEVSLRWVFDSDEEGSEYEGQGNHQFSVADVDGDQKDEVVFGSMTIDDDGSPLYNTRLGHGDALHVSDFDPDRAGLEVFMPHESPGSNGGIISSFRDAATGEVLWSDSGSRDTGRGAAGDIDPRYDGAEAWNVGDGGAWNSPSGFLHTADGEVITNEIPAANFVTWWDGDLLREITDHDFDGDTGSGVPTVSKWDWEAESEVELLRAEGTLTNNGTKGNPAIQADLLGDWREEVVVRTEDSSALRILTTTDLTEHRIPTLMQDPVYRLAVAGQNVAYNQPPHPSYYLGEGMAEVPDARVTFPAATTMDVEAAAEASCAGDRAQLTVTVSNQEQEPLAVRAVSSAGAQSFVRVPAGQERTVPFTADGAELAAGSVAVTAVAADGTGAETVLQADHGSVSCR